MWRSGSIRAGIGEPLVVDVAACLEQIEIRRLGRTHQQRVVVEGDGLTVLAVVEDDLRRNSIGVEVRHPGVNVVVPRRLRLAMRTPQSAPVWSRRTRPSASLPRQPPRCRELTGIRVELVAEDLRAVRPQVFHQAGADVRVARTRLRTEGPWIPAA